MHQYSVAVNNAALDAKETATGTAPVLRFYTGSMPANCAAAATGTQLATQALPSDWLSNASAAAKAKAGTWTGTYGASGTVGYWRIWDTAVANCHWQGLAFQTLAPINTSALTAANGNVLTFASTTGVVVGMKIAGTGVHPDAFVVAVTSTLVTMSHTSTAGVSSAVAITFSGDMTLDNVVAASGQAWTVNSFSVTANNQ
jgi:hypothetical protein